MNTLQRVHFLGNIGVFPQSNDGTTGIIGYSVVFSKNGNEKSLNFLKELIARRLHVTSIIPDDSGTVNGKSDMGVEIGGLPVKMETL